MKRFGGDKKYLYWGVTAFAAAGRLPVLRETRPAGLRAPREAACLPLFCPRAEVVMVLSLMPVSFLA